MGAQMTRSARLMSLHSLRQQFTELAPDVFNQKIARAWLQEDCPLFFVPPGNRMAWIYDSMGLSAILDRVLAELDIRYYITGSVAAIAYGEPRTAGDLNLVLAASMADVDRLTAAVEANGFYVLTLDGVKPGRMAALRMIHTASISKASLLISGPDDFELGKFFRTRLIGFPGLPDLNFISPEDLVLSKLLWGQHTEPEKQWRDVLGVVKVQADRLDDSYLSLWAKRLGIKDLAKQALTAGR